MYKIMITSGDKKFKVVIYSVVYLEVVIILLSSGNCLDGRDREDSSWISHKIIRS